MDRRQAGFSLIELMVAMTITLIVSGAIYGLLSSGQNAFRREPELIDRQQNARIAMDMILRDIEAAGAGLPERHGHFVQYFAPALDGDGNPVAFNNAFPRAPLTPFADVGPPPAGGLNGRVDELEILSNPAGFLEEETCAYDSGGADTLDMRRMRTSLAPGQVVLLVMDDPAVVDNGLWTLRTVTGIGLHGNAPGSGDVCDGTLGAVQVQLQFTPGDASDVLGLNVGGLCTPNGFGNVNGAAPCQVRSVTGAELIRYRIRDVVEAGRRVPNLERWSSANLPNPLPANGGYQVVARGIEDLQVRYTRADGAISNGAPMVDITGGADPGIDPADYAGIVTQVEVTLSARSTGVGRIQGQTVVATNVALPAAHRGSLRAVAAVRQGLYALAQAPQASPPPSPPILLWR